MYNMLVICTILFLENELKAKFVNCLWLQLLTLLFPWCWLAQHNSMGWILLCRLSVTLLSTTPHVCRKCQPVLTTIGFFFLPAVLKFLIKTNAEVILKHNKIFYPHKQKYYISIHHISSLFYFCEAHSEINNVFNGDFLTLNWHLSPLAFLQIRWYHLKLLESIKCFSWVWIVLFCRRKSL